MIISFAGRMKSGKSELAKICENYGYERLSFAIPLKQLCADILDISIDELNRAKNEGIPIQITIGKDVCEILSEETNIPIETTTEICNGKYLHTVRDMLQFIGTDYIRKYNKDWHVNKLKEMIDVNKDYVFDDVRFPNEKKFINDLGGDCWFVSRTTLDNISNHESETSLTWQQCFNKIIINDKSLQYLLLKWETFMQNYGTSRSIRDREFERILEIPSENIKEMSMLDWLFISNSLFTYTPREFDKEKIEKAVMNDDKTVTITYKNGMLEFIDNQLIIEDLKKYL